VPGSSRGSAAAEPVAAAAAAEPVAAAAAAEPVAAAAAPSIPGDGFWSQFDDDMAWCWARPDHVWRSGSHGGHQIVEM
jgi:hypothetical protein